MPVNKPRRAVVAPPAGATHWSLASVVNTTGRKEDGKKYSTAKTKTLHGTARPDGSVPEVWPVAEFSMRRVLDTWGAGRYRVTWYGSDDEKISGDVFQVDLPPDRKAAAPTPRAARAPRAEHYEEAPTAGPHFDPTLPTSQAGWAMLMQDREERAAERRRVEAKEEEQRREAAFERQRAADREHTQSLIAALTAGRGNAAPAVDSELIRREMAVTVREQMGGFRAEFGTLLAGLQANKDRGGRDNDDPDDLAEGAERIGLRVLSELEDAAPELVEACIPGFIALLQGRGWKPSAEILAALDGLKGKHNGTA